MQNRIHQTRLANAKSSVDANISPVIKNAMFEDRDRKREISKAKEQELIRKNNILLKKLSEISNRPLIQTDSIIHDRHSQRRAYILQREHLRKQSEITADNLKILARLEAQRPKVDASVISLRASSAGANRQRTRSNFRMTQQWTITGSRENSSKSSEFRVRIPRFDGGLPAFSKKLEREALLPLEFNRGDEEAQNIVLEHLKEWRTGGDALTRSKARLWRGKSSVSELVNQVESEMREKGGSGDKRKSKGRLFGYESEPLGKPLIGSELWSESGQETRRTTKSFFQKLTR